MSDKVDYNHLCNIIKDAPGFTLGECNGILSTDDSYVNDFKLKVIPFCSESIVECSDIEKIVTTADYDSVNQVINNLQDYDECNEFAKAFVDEVTAKIKNKKWYHQIVIMQCAIIDAIHTIFKKYDEPLTSCVDNEIILGLATKFDAWFDNLKKSNTKAIELANTKASDIDTTVKNFSERLRLGKGVYDESNDQRFEKFLKSFETDYMNTDDYDWIDKCTKGLASTGDIKTLKTQLTNLKKAIQDKNWLAASLAMLIAQLSKTLEKIFEVGNNSKDAVRHSVTAVIEQQQKKQQQKLLQNFLNKLDTSCLPFNAYAWWEYFVESTSFDESLDNPLCNFMQCITGEIEGDIHQTITKLSDELSNVFAVNDTDSVTETLERIVKRASETKETTNKKYDADIVENLLNVIDYVDAQGTVDLNPKSNIWLLVLNELCAFIATEEQRKTALEFIYGVFKEINEQLDQETLAESATDLLVNSGVINTDEKGPAVEKIKGKIEELQNKRTSNSSTTVQQEPKPQMIENNTTHVTQETNSPATDPQQLSSPTSEFEKLQTFLDALEKSSNSDDATSWYSNFIQDETFLLEFLSEIDDVSNDLAGFMQCVKGEIDDDLDDKINALSSKLCGIFNVENANSVVTSSLKNIAKSAQPPKQPMIINPRLSLAEFVSKKLKAPESVRTHVTSCAKTTCFLCERLTRIKQKIDTGQESQALELIEDFATNHPNLTVQGIDKNELTNWQDNLKQKIVTANFKKERDEQNKQKDTNAKELKKDINELPDTIEGLADLNLNKKGSTENLRFAERAVSKQERKKHTEQKNKNDIDFVKVTKALPNTIDALANFDLTSIRTILNKTNYGLQSLGSSDIDTLTHDTVSAEKIETIAKPLRKTAKKRDSIVALAMLYKVLAVAKINVEQPATIKTLFIAFAKWFNKYVSPRSAIRSPKVVKALNDTVGKMAENTNAFKCGKLTRAKNAANEIAKKISTKSDSSVDTNSGSAGHKKCKREKLKSNLEKLSPRKLISRKKKQKTNKEA